MAAPAEARKHRQLVFSSDPPGQAERAYELLKGLDDFQVQLGPQPNSLYISYDLAEYSLEKLEQALIREGFHFDDSALDQLGKKLVYYSEEVEFHNLSVPQRPAKDREREIFAKAYEHHLHGDHDDTPPELREYK